MPHLELPLRASNCLEPALNQWCHATYSRWNGPYRNWSWWAKSIMQWVWLSSWSSLLRRWLGGVWHTTGTGCSVVPFHTVFLTTSTGSINMSMRKKWLTSIERKKTKMLYGWSSSVETPFEWWRLLNKIYQYTTGGVFSDHHRTYPKIHSFSISDSKRTKNSWNNLLKMWQQKQKHAS